MTGLYGASLEGNAEIVEYLLNHGADVNQPTVVSNCLAT
jgi:ankyrin repeat protein